MHLLKRCLIKEDIRNFNFSTIIEHDISQYVEKTSNEIESTFNGKSMQ